MSEHERALRHEPFFVALSNADEHDPEWRSVSAGLVVLRLVDAWIEEGAAAVRRDAWGVRSVRSAIDGLAGGGVRSVLESILECMTTGAGGRAALLARVVAYARLLDHAGQWDLSADAYETVARHCHPVVDADLAIESHLRIGMCRRQLNDLEGSAAAYRAARDLADAVGDLMGVLRSCIGDAKVAIASGNMPRAESILDETISRAAESDLPAVHSMALHDRATVAGMKGEYELSVKLAYDAYTESRNPNDRDRILSDIATAFIQLGVYTAARDAHLVLAMTAQEQYVRWNSTLNLMDLASRMGAQTLFEQYRRELSAAPLPPYLAAALPWMAGNGYARFNQRELAREQYARALELATAGKYHKMVFDIEAGLEALERAERPVGPVELVASISDVGVINVADELSRLRDRTLVTA